MIRLNSPDLEHNSTCWDFKHNAKGENMKLKIQSIRDYFRSKEKRGLKPIFLESIGNQNTSRDQMLKNFIKALEKNGFKIKNKK